MGERTTSLSVIPQIGGTATGTGGMHILTTVTSSYLSMASGVD